VPLKPLIVAVLVGLLAPSALADSAKLTAPPPPPARVTEAITKTEDAAFLHLVETTTDGGQTSDILNTRTGEAEIVTGAKISLIEIGHDLYAPSGRKDGCFVRRKRQFVLLPDTASALLPSSENGLVYQIGRHTIKWRMTIAPKGHPKYHPFGSVRLDSAGRIVSSSIYDGTTLLLRATISYPSRAPRITAPRSVC
jgi:hypothetical protein